MIVTSIIVVWVFLAIKWFDLIRRNAKTKAELPEDDICTMQSSSRHIVTEVETPPSYAFIESEGPPPAYASDIVRKYKHWIHDNQDQRKPPRRTWTKNMNNFPHFNAIKNEEVIVSLFNWSIDFILTQLRFIATWEAENFANNEKESLWTVWRCNIFPLPSVINFWPCDATLGPIGQLQHIWSLSVKRQMSVWQLWWAGIKRDIMLSVHFVIPQGFHLSSAVIVRSSCPIMYIVCIHKIVRSKKE